MSKRKLRRKLKWLDGRVTAINDLHLERESDLRAEQAVLTKRIEALAKRLSARSALGGAEASRLEALAARVEVLEMAAEREVEE